jgi:hypothetical protein
MKHEFHPSPEETRPRLPKSWRLESEGPGGSYYSNGALSASLSVNRDKEDGRWLALALSRNGHTVDDRELADLVPLFFGRRRDAIRLYPRGFGSAGKITLLLSNLDGPTIPEFHA